MTRVRGADAADAAAIAAIYAPHVLAGTVSFEHEAPDAAAMAARIAASDGLYPWLVAEDEDDGVVGYAYATRFRDRAAYRWAVETSVYVAEAAQGRGIGGRLYAALTDTLTAQGFTLAVATIALPNAASVALHERIGFRAAGMIPGAGYKFGRWIDIGCWHRPLASPTRPPCEPEPAA